MRVETFPRARRQGAGVRFHRHRRRLRRQCRGRGRAARRRARALPARSAATDDDDQRPHRRRPCAPKASIARGAVRVAGAQRVGVAHPARRRAARRSIATRRGHGLSERAAAPTPRALVARRRCGAGRQPLSGIRRRRSARAAQARSIPRRPRPRQADPAGRSAAGARHACDRLGRSAARQPPARTISARRWRGSPRTTKASSPSPTDRTGVIGCDGGALRHMPAFKVDGDRHARRRRRVSRRLHAGAGRRPRRRRPRCASPARRPRSNARASAAPPARPSAPRSTRSWRRVRSPWSRSRRAGPDCRPGSSCGRLPPAPTWPVD